MTPKTALIACLLAPAACLRDIPERPRVETAEETGDKPGEAGDDFEHATPLDLEPRGQAVWRDAISPAGDRDIFRVRVEEGRVVVVSTERGASASALDTVLLLYDEGGAPLAWNDDMPYGVRSTWSSLVFEAAATADYFLEVRDWSDDSGEVQAAGGDDFTYTLRLFSPDVTEDDADDDVPEAALEASLAASPYTALWFNSDMLLFLGRVETPGDRDCWPLQAREAVWCQWSLWPGALPRLRPVFSLLDDTGRRLAETWDPSWRGGATVFYDGGVLRRLEAGERVSLCVEDAAGAGGATGFFYPGMLACFLDTLGTTELEPNDDATLANSIDVKIADDDESLYFARFSGQLEGADQADHLRFRTTGGLSLVGRRLDLTLETHRHGSPLDLRVTLELEEVAGQFRTVASATTRDAGGEDVGIQGLELAVDAPLHLRVERDVFRSLSASGAWFGLLTAREADAPELRARP